MDPYGREAFQAEYVKIAIGPRLLAAGLRAAEQRGANIAPKILGSLEHQLAQGVTKVNPAAARGIVGDARGALNANFDMRQSLQNPVTQNMRQRVLGGYERAAANAPGVRDASKALPAHYDYGVTARANDLHGYSQGHIDSIMGRAQLHDPRGVGAPTARAANPLHATPPMGASQVNPTAPTQIHDPTQLGQVGGRSVPVPNAPIPQVHAVGGGSSAAPTDKTIRPMRVRPGVQAA